MIHQNTSSIGKRSNPENLVMDERQAFLDIPGLYL